MEFKDFAMILLSVMSFCIFIFLLSKIDIMRQIFAIIERWLENKFCNSDDCYPMSGGGGRYCNPDGTPRFTDAERSAEDAYLNGKLKNK